MDYFTVEQINSVMDEHDKLRDRVRTVVRNLGLIRNGIELISYLESVFQKDGLVVAEYTGQAGYRHTVNFPIGYLLNDDYIQIEEDKQKAKQASIALAIAIEEARLRERRREEYLKLKEEFGE